jgi:hypothetical protein
VPLVQSMPSPQAITILRDVYLPSIAARNVWPS